MRVSKLLCHVARSAVVAAAAIAAPPPGTSGTLTDPGAPQWLDQTVYRPDPVAIEYDCDCRFARDLSE
jgi:hypothetical protein